MIRFGLFLLVTGQGTAQNLIFIGKTAFKKHLRMAIRALKNGISAQQRKERG
jgi:hypothetical protein